MTEPPWWTSSWAHLHLPRRLLLGSSPVFALLCPLSWCPNHLLEDQVLVFTAYSNTDEAFVLPNRLPSLCRSCSADFCRPLVSQPEPSDFSPLETSTQAAEPGSAETGGWFRGICSVLRGSLQGFGGLDMRLEAARVQGSRQQFMSLLLC